MSNEGEISSISFLIIKKENCKLYIHLKKIVLYIMKKYPWMPKFEKDTLKIKEKCVAHATELKKKK